MTIYVCLDDRNGMLFNHRRQSRDIAVLQDLEQPVYIDVFSEKLFLSSGIPYQSAPEDLGQLPKEGGFFLENRKPEMLLSLADKVVIYRWNRHYPGDFYWNVDLKEQGFTLESQCEFPGKSHETITREVYVK